MFALCGAGRHAGLPLPFSFMRWAVTTNETLSRTIPVSPGYAEVAVNSPACGHSTFSYSIPAGVSVRAGHAVWVPFGPRTLQGIVIGLASQSQVPETRAILSAIGSDPVLSEAQIALARWMSEHYLAPLFDCLSLMLPPGLDRRLVTVFTLGSGNPHEFSLNERELAVLELVRRQTKVSLKDMERSVGKLGARRMAASMVKRGLLHGGQEIERPKVRAKSRLYVCLAVKREEASERASEMRSGRAAKQAAVLELLISTADSAPAAEILRNSGAGRAAIAGLVRKGLVVYEYREVVRDPLSHRAYPEVPAPVLTDSQAAAWKVVEKQIESEVGPKGRVFLLHGVTGSGKTELYLRALESVVARGKRGIVLVPEISLTPQTIGRFAARFHGRVALLHSRLSPGEQHDEWMRIRRGDFDVVIGPRSALFAPQPDLGLIVVDEEHEWSYKQQENQPRYHARDVAVKMAALCGVTVILGSATPDVETYCSAEQGEYHLLKLPERITPWGVAPLPSVEVVDMREELKSGNRSIFSRPLRQALADVLNRREQAIIFLNRRGTSTFVMCRNCGYVSRCRRCQVSLTYHASGRTRVGGSVRRGSSGPSLVCHYCNTIYPVPTACPNCMSAAIRFMGIGTEKLEGLLWREFPSARTIRWDRDASSKKHSDEEILDQFLAHDADILVGTQMIAKGLDIPQVTLVGVVNADIGLHLPDLRSGERTFQLLCQVAGRAGRGESGGRVIIQTYNAAHYAVRAAATHDYDSFYRREISFRRALGDPPFSRMVRLVYSHTNEMRCREEAERFTRVIEGARNELGLADPDIIGPAPAYVSRLRGKYRWQVLLKGTDPARFLASLPVKQGWTIDVDPLSTA